MSSKIACFVSSHGFGHSARVAAVIESAQTRYRDLRFEVFTGAPDWFFADSITDPPRIHPQVVDFGLVQRNALEEDLAASIRQLRSWAPPPAARIREFARQLRATGAELVLCDIAPLGILAAREAGIPSVLQENFTWDFIYGGYRDAEPALGELADRLAEVFEAADHRIQAEPFCRAAPGAVVVPPISRRPRSRRPAIRRELGLTSPGEPDAPIVLLTMGGIPWSFEDLAQSLDEAEVPGRPWLVIPGGADEPTRRGRTLCLPHRSRWYHPDLIHAADAVVGKLGYSTVAEVAAAGVPFAYVPRDRFPESPPLETWVTAHLPSLRISAARFLSGEWLRDLGPLLALGASDGDASRDRNARSDGADLAADALVGWLPEPLERSTGA